MYRAVRLSKLIVALFLAASATAGKAAADTIDTFAFVLTRPNSDVAEYPGPYIKVTINLASDHKTANVIFDSLTASASKPAATYTYLMVDGGSAGVNVNATKWTLSNLGWTKLNSTFADPILSDAGAGREDGFGQFNQRIKNFDSFKHAANEIFFTLTNNTGTWSDAKNVLAKNSSGWIAAAHIAVTSTGNRSDGALETGYVAGDGSVPPTQGPSAPEPASLLLFGGLFGGLGLLGLRRRRRSLAND
jgi:hypothetical protein